MIEKADIPDSSSWIHLGSIKLLLEVQVMPFKHDYDGPMGRENSSQLKGTAG